jgi:hypothetical protein
VHPRLTLPPTTTRQVLETLEPLDGDRTCFRLINGILTERTVKDVIPALKTNTEGLSKVLEDLVKQYKAKEDELERWKVRRPLCEGVRWGVASGVADCDIEEEQDPDCAAGGVRGGSGGGGRPGSVAWVRGWGSLWTAAAVFCAWWTPWARLS